MKRRVSILAVLALALTCFALPAFAAGRPDTAGPPSWANDENARQAENGDIVYRCATEEKGQPKGAPAEDEIRQWISENRIAAGGVVPVNFHVISGRNGEGNIPESWLDAQITVLNNNYAGKNYGGASVPGAANTGYTFVKNSVTRTNNKRWFGMTPGSGAEAQAKNALVVNPTGSLNFYTAKPGQNLLGWATFPWNLAGNPNMDGVVVHYNSLPGGTLAPYNLGGTGSHEVGHWVGLYHTFQGGCAGGDASPGCTTGGDLVCDTAAEATATSGCPAGKNTCASDGNDPIHNYMDYSTDICYDNFTSGQDARADFMMATYRPVIGSARLPVADASTEKKDPYAEHGPAIADNGEKVYRCATEEKGQPKGAPAEDEIRQWISENRIAAGGVVPVNFHVIYSGAAGTAPNYNAASGNVPESWLDAQITVLNNNYAGKNYGGASVPGAANTGYTFVKASVTRTSASGQRKKWFTMTPGSGAEAQAKNALVVNPTGSLNFYTAKPGQNLLGWATFPWNLAGNPNMDGVVIHFQSLPGGPLAPYNLGGTGSHEVGHWVGLYHTFQGGCAGGDASPGCTTGGDLVCDTAAEATATSGCPAGKNTCASDGNDPIHNYMDYSTDICYDNFTSGQDARADFMMATYRPVIGSARDLANAAGNGNSLQNAMGKQLVEFRARPNPFNPRTKISFGTIREGRASVRVFDIHGRLVATVVDRRLPAGNHEFDFDAARLSSGVYLMKLQSEGRPDEVRRISLLK